jgi:hypothetical protein
MERAVIAVHPVADLVVLAFADGGLFWFAEAIAHVGAFSFSLALFTAVVMAWSVGSFALPGIPYIPPELLMAPVWDGDIRH